MKNIMLIGASGHGKIVAEIAQFNGYSNILFIDQAYPKKTKNGAWSIVEKPDRKILLATKNTDFFISIGNNKIREKISEELKLTNCPILSHSSSIVSPYAQIGKGTLICAGSIVNIDAKIGKFAIINTAASIDHDCEIGDFVHVSLGVRLAGGVTIGARTWVGIGAMIKENIKIGKDVIIGAGAVVLNDVEDGETVFGIPAKPIKG